MSRIGNQLISIPPDVTVGVEKHNISVKGPKGELVVAVPERITVELGGEGLVVGRAGNSKSIQALHGFMRATLANAVAGVSKGWTKTLELSGVGYRATLSGANLVLTVGFSHPVTITPPPGVTFAVSDGKVIVSGFSKQLVGQIAADVRAVKPPEPYKGKGIKYAGEVIRKKAGKSAKAIGGAPGAK